MRQQTESIAIVAAPGMGKTRLVEEFLAGLSVTKNVVLRGYCESYLSAEPLQPILQILRKLYGADAKEKHQTPFDPASQQLRNHPAPSHVLEIFKAFITAMGMFWYADRTQALEGRLRSLSPA